MNRRVCIAVFLVFSLPFSLSAETGAGTSAGLPYTEFIFPPDQISSSHAPSIVELPDGSFFAAWYAPPPGKKNGAIWASRKKAGRGWTKPSVINYNEGYSNKNPVLYLNRDKKLVLFWVEEKRWYRWPVDRLKMKVSDDLGRTWGRARDVGTPISFLTRTHPLTLSDGRVLLPIYTDMATSSAVILSKDGGLTWGNLRFILFFFGIQPTVIQRSDSSLFALTRTGMWPRLSWEAESRDFGNSWKNPRVSTIRNPGSSLEMLKLKNGHVVLVFNDSRTDRSSLSLALSYDEGDTWTHTRVIEDAPESVNIYHSIMQDKDGLILVLYSYHGRQTIAHFVTYEEWIKGG